MRISPNSIYLVIVLVLLWSCEKDKAKPVDITDHVWELEYLKVKSDKTQPENQYLLEFVDDSRFRMDFSVNIAGGDYMIINDGEIEFQNYHAFTEKCCDNDFDQKLSIHLEKVNQYEVNKNNLILTGNEEELKFNKR